MFQNVKGLTHTSTKEDYNYYLQCIEGLDVDIKGLSESAGPITIYLRTFDIPCADMLGEASRFLALYHQTLINVFSTKHFNWVGIERLFLDSLVARLGGPDIVDKTGLGRWSGIVLTGPDSRKLAIITAYRVCSGSPHTSLLGSSYLREYEFFRERCYTSPNPRRRFFNDLQKTILEFQDAGHGTILMLDAISTLDDNQLLDFLARCGLKDLHSADPALSTYIGSANRRIDYIFGFDEASLHVIRSGTLAYTTEGPQSDHRSLHVDLSPTYITSPPWHSINQLQSRHLHTGNPELVTAYHTAMLSYYDQHGMVSRIQQLYKQKDLMPREDRPRKMG